MKAAQINEYGDASVVKINEIEQPTPSKDQVLVEVHNSSLNPFDTVIRAGYMQEMIPLEFPVTLGGDIAGVVTAIGEDVTDFTVGEAVYGQANVVAGNTGAFAEYAATQKGQIAKMPANLDFAEAGSLPLVGISALQALTEYLDLQTGQKIFIHGGAGGIGTIAIQIAKNTGAYVATTAKAEDTEFVKERGADQVIDYRTQNFADVLSEYDAVFDLVGGDDFNKALTILKRGGKAVSMIAQADEAKATELGVTALSQATQVTTDALNILTKLIEDGIVTPQIGKTFSLDQIKEAFEARESGSIRGKVSLVIKA